ncbi:MAG: helix-turn-helix domain-containing protein, partial [Romboutsia sp.]|nr:helix-turn-helix domain-containing protein [Romboutsia sp.]
EYIKENNINPKWEEKKRLKLILDGDSRKNDEIVLDLLNQGMSLNDVCNQVEVSISTALGYICDYINNGNTINFKLDLDKLYTSGEKDIIIKSIEKFGDYKISIIKKNIPDFIKYESIRAVILERMLEK